MLATMKPDPLQSKVGQTIAFCGLSGSGRTPAGTPAWQAGGPLYGGGKR